MIRVLHGTCTVRGQLTVLAYKLDSFALSVRTAEWGTHVKQTVSHFEKISDMLLININIQETPDND